MSKYTLLPNEAHKGRYETREFKISGRVRETISIANGDISMTKGSNYLSVSENTEMSRGNLKSFIDEYFNKPDTVLVRVDAVVNPKKFETIF